MTSSHSHHTHDHDPGEPHKPPSNNAAFAIGITLNIGFVVVEVVYGLAANSLALLSDAGHNLSDVFGLLIAWGAVHLSKSLPTKRRTYGLRRSSILAALVNAITLLVVVGGITWEAILRFQSPEAVLADTVRSLDAAGIAFGDLSLRKPTLDDVFLTLTGRSAEEAVEMAGASAGADLVQSPARA